jgi:hypothetical protein
MQSSDDETKILVLRRMLESSLIPHANYFVLKRLMSLLNEILKYSDENMMDLDDLIQVFGPLTLKSFGDEETRTLMRLLILHNERIFRDHSQKNSSTSEHLSVTENNSNSNNNNYNNNTNIIQLLFGEDEE